MSSNFSIAGSGDRDAKEYPLFAASPKKTAVAADAHVKKASCDEIAKIQEEFVLSPEKLREASLIDALKNPQLSEKFTDPSDHLFTHLHLESRALATGFEGTQAQKTIDWTKHVLKILADNKAVGDQLLPVAQANTLREPIGQLLEQTLKIDDLARGGEDEDAQEHIIRKEAETIARKVQQLAPGTSYLLPGGYAASPLGHTMFYRFIRESDQTYTVILYNAGEGVQWQGERNEEDEPFGIPYVVYSKVTAEELFFSSNEKEQRGDLFQTLLDLKVLPRAFPDDKRFVFGIADVVKAFAPIQHRRSDEGHYYRLFMTLQKAGTCSQKSLNALLHDLMRDRKAYRALHLNSRLLSLVNFYHAQASNLNSSSVEMGQVRHQLREAAVNLCQKLSLYANRSRDAYPELTPTQLRRFYATAQEIIAHVDKAEKNVRQQIQKRDSFSFKAAHTPHARPSGLRQLARQVEELRPPVRDAIATPVHQTYPASLAPGDFFGELIDLKERHRQASPQKIIAETEAFLNALPVPQRYPDDRYWSKVGDSYVFADMSFLLRRYLKATKEVNISQQAEQYNAIRSALAIMHQLCWQHDAKRKNLLQQHSLGLTYLENIYQEDPHLITRNPKTWERSQKLTEYFKAVHKPEQELFQYSENCTVKDPTFQPELNLYQRILDQHPDFLDKKVWLSHMQSRFRGLELSNRSLLSLAFLEESHLLQKVGENSIACLREMVVETLSHMTEGESVDTKQCFSEIDSVSGKVTWTISGQKLSKKRLQRGQRDWTEEALKPLTQPALQPYLERNPEKNSAWTEGAHLKKLFEGEADDRMQRLASLAGASCASDATVSTLLSRLAQDSTLVETAEAQALIEHLLYKPTALAKGETATVPLFEALKERPEETMALFRTAISRGLDTHFSLCSAERAHFPAALFWVRLGQRVETVYAQIHPKNEALALYPREILADMEKQLLRERPPRPSLQAAVTLYQLADDTSASTDGLDRNVIYKRWLFLHSLGPLTRFAEVDRRLYREISQRMRANEPTLLEWNKREPEEMNAFVNGLVKAMHLESDHQQDNSLLSSDLRWATQTWHSPSHSILFEEGTLTFHTKLADGTPISCNLSTGCIASDRGPFNLGTLNTESKNFQAVFGQRQLTPTYGFGTTTSFVDSLYGSCRLLNGDATRGIQRQIDGRWATYIPLEEIEQRQEELQLPKALRAGYCHWIDKDSETGKPQLWIAHQETGEDCFLLDAEGEIQALADGRSPRDATVLERLDEKSAALLKAVEDPDYILSWKRGRKRARVEFQRYRTAAGQPLAFSVKEGRWNDETDPAYCLDRNASTPWLGHFTGFLPLIHKDGKRRKLLVPDQTITSKGFSPEASLIIPEGKARGKPQEGIYTYHTFSIKQGVVVADSVEGWLRLTQIFAAQKDTLQAMRCLRQVTLSDELNSTACTLLKEILASGSLHADYSPNACAVRLHAFWLLKTLDPLPSYQKLESQEGPKAEHQTVEEIYRTYLAGLSYVDDPLRLFSEKEIALIEFLEGDQFARRLAFLQAGRYERTKEKAFAAPPLRALDLRKHPVYFPEEADLDFQHRLPALKKQSFSYYKEDFLSAYTILKQGNPAERNALIYRLRWHPPLPENMSPCYQPLLHFVYRYPEYAPDPIAPEASEKEKKAWWSALIQAAKEQRTKEDGAGLHDPFSEQHTSPHAKYVTHFHDRAAPIESPKPPVVSLDLQWLEEEKAAPAEQVLDTIRRQYLAPRAPLPPQEESPRITLDPETLQTSERPLAAVIEAECKAFNEELVDGASRAVQEAAPAFKPRLFSQAERQLRALKASEEEKRQKLEKEALALARRLPIEESQRLQVSLARTGFAREKVTMITLARVVALGDLAGYAQRALHLNPQETQKLQRLVVLILISKTTEDQIDRVLAPLASAAGEARTNARAQAAAALAAERTYIPKDNLQALYFEYASGLRLREKQALLFRQLTQQLIKKGTPTDQKLLFQMIQGGGKSSVILSRLMELLAEKGCLSIFVCHHSQLSSAKGNLKAYQQQRFHKNVIPLNYASAELEKLPVLKKIARTLQEARAHKETVIVDSHLVQALQLHLLLLLQQRATNEEERGLVDAKIQALQQIQRQLLEHGVGLFDEFHLTLSMLQQVHIPTGRRQLLHRDRLALVQEIFHILATPEIDGQVRLSQNEQSTLPETTYREKIAPRIADALWQHFPTLQVPKTHRSAFCRYLSYQTQKENTGDARFLAYLQKLQRSSDPSKKEAAQRIALARGIIGKILPATLNKSYNRDYGIDPKHPERIIPYLAVGVPAETEFGHVYEHLCYVLQAAVNAPLPQETVARYAEIMTQLANHYVSKGERFERTAEAQQFEALTGVPLGEAMQGDALMRATDGLNRNPDNRIALQAELAAHTVSHFATFLSSSPLALIDQFKSGVGCSGTVDNAQAVSPPFKPPLRDRGAEGKVITTLLARFDAGKRPVRPVTLDTLSGFLKETLDPLPKKNTHCLIDGGGLLKRWSSREVAEELLRYYKEKDGNAQIKGVVFFHRTRDPDDPQKVREQFALLKAGSSQPIPLANTAREEIEKHGLPVTQLFFSLDELRATGSDLPLPEKAHAVGTTTAEDLSKLVQMVMRLRRFFAGQEIDLVIPQAAERTLIGNSCDLKAVIRTALKNRALRKADETLRAFKEQIPHAFRTQLMRALLQEKSPERAAALMHAFSPFFVAHAGDDPYAEFGALEEERSIAALLKTIQESQKEQFQQCRQAAGDLLPKNTLQQIYEKALYATETVIAQAAGEPALNYNVRETGASALGIRMRQEIALELEQEQQQRVTLALEEEQQSYSVVGEGEPFEEIPWNSQAIKSWNLLQLGPEIERVSTLLKQCDSGDAWGKRTGLYRTDYSGCFPSHLKMTENLQHTLTTPLPLFHRMQKPAEHLLIRRKRDGELECILLSQQDAAFWLHRGQTPPDVWLLNPEGEPLMPGKSHLPGKDNALFWSLIDESLWHVNLFNGTVSALERNPALTQRLWQPPPAPMYRFLYQRTAHRPQQRQLLEQSLLFSPDAADSRLLSQKRRQRERDTAHAIAEMGEEKIASLPPEQVRYVPASKVCYLTTPAQIRQLLPTQVNQMDSKQVNQLFPAQVLHLQKPHLIQALQKPLLIKQVPSSHAQHLSDEQYCHHPLGIQKLKTSQEIQALDDPDLVGKLGPHQMDHVLPKQVPYLTTECIPHLNKPKQIAALQGKRQINALDSRRLSQLTPKQVNALRKKTLIRQLPKEQIPHLHPRAIPFLDVKCQLPHLTPQQMIHISPQQYENIRQRKPLPEVLKPLWARISPQTLDVYKNLLDDVSSVTKKPFLKQQIPGMTKWGSLLSQIDLLTPKDYDSITHLNLNLCDQLPPPPELFKCKQLICLEFSACDLSSFERGEHSFGNFPHLEILSLQKCKLQEVPPSIQRLSQLKQLDLNCNALKTPPPWLKNLRQLETLDMGKCQLQEVPPSIQKLSQLKKLYLDHNALKTLPPWLKDLKQLEVLNIGINLFELFPESLPFSPGLTTLNLRNNSLKILPLWLKDLKQLELLVISNNPLETVPDPSDFPNVDITNDKDPQQEGPRSLSSQEALSFPLDLNCLIADNRPIAIQQHVQTGQLNPNVSITTKKGEETLLAWAIRQQHETLIQEIVKRGGNLTSLDSKQRTPLTLLYHYFPKNHELIKHVMKKIPEERVSPRTIQELLTTLKKTDDLVDRQEIWKSLQLALPDHLKPGERSWLRLGWWRFRAACTTLFHSISKSSLRPPSWEGMDWKLREMETTLSQERVKTNELLKQLEGGDDASLKKLTDLAPSERQKLLRWARFNNFPEATLHLIFPDIPSDPHQIKNSVIANTILDKHLIKTKIEEDSAEKDLREEALYTMRPYVASKAIIQGLKQFLTNPEATIPKQMTEHLKDVLLPALIRATAWSKMLAAPDAKEETLVQELFGILDQMKLHQKVLVPLTISPGNAKASHNLLLQVEKTGEESYSLKVINTGLGISHHARLGDKRLFQTYKTIVDIPASSIHRKELWHELLALRHTDSEKGDEHYALIKKLGEEGAEVPPSDERVDYSTAQLQNTCAALPWWHWLRHELVAVGTESDDRWMAYAHWRSIKHAAKRAMLEDIGENVLIKKIYRAAKTKIDKHAQQSRLIVIADNQEQFNQTMQSLKEMLQQLISSKKEIRQTFDLLDRDFSDYPNTGARWQALRTVCKQVAQERLQTKNYAKWKKLFEGSEEPHLCFTLLTLVDFENSETNLQLLLEDAERKKKWEFIGDTLGRLALDPKLAPLALRLGKQWLTLSKKARVDLSDQKVQEHEETIQEKFLFYVTRGKGQERALRMLASHYNKQDTRVSAEKLWRAHYLYLKKTLKETQLGDLVYNEQIAIEDIVLIANVLNSEKNLDATTALLFGLRNHALEPATKRVIHSLVDTAKRLDDNEMSNLRGLTHILYQNHFDDLFTAICQQIEASS